MTKILFVCLGNICRSPMAEMIMKNEAKKKAVNGFAMFTPDEGFALVLKYFDIKNEKNEIPEVKVPVKKSSRFEVKLDDFL